MFSDTDTDTDSNTKSTPAKPKSRWNLEIILAELILVSFVVLASMQVIARYVFNAPFIWIEELSAALLIWMTFLGAAGVVKSEGHIKVEFFEELLGAKITSALELVWNLLIIAFLVLLVIGGIQAFKELSFERTPALRLPISWVITIVPITAGLMALYYTASVVRRVGRFFGGRRHLD